MWKTGIVDMVWRRCVLEIWKIIPLMGGKLELKWYETLKITLPIGENLIIDVRNRNWNWYGVKKVWFLKFEIVWDFENNFFDVKRGVNCRLGKLILVGIRVGKRFFFRGWNFWKSMEKGVVLMSEF